MQDTSDGQYHSDIKNREWIAGIQKKGVRALPRGWRRAGEKAQSLFVVSSILWAFYLFPAIVLMFDSNEYIDPMLCVCNCVLAVIVLPLLYVTFRKRLFFANGFNIEEVTARDVIERALCEKGIQYIVCDIQDVISPLMRRRYATVFCLQSHLLFIRVRKKRNDFTFIEVGPFREKQEIMASHVVNLMDEAFTEAGYESYRSSQFMKRVRKGYWFEWKPHIVQSIFIVLILSCLSLFLWFPIEWIGQQWHISYLRPSVAEPTFFYIVSQASLAFWSVVLLRYNRKFRYPVMKKKFDVHEEHIEMIKKLLIDRQMAIECLSEERRMPLFLLRKYREIIGIQPNNLYVRIGKKTRWGSYIEIGSPDKKSGHAVEQLKKEIDALFEQEEQEIVTQDQYVPPSYRT